MTRLTHALEEAGAENVYAFVFDHLPHHVARGRTVRRDAEGIPGDANRRVAPTRRAATPARSPLSASSELTFVKYTRTTSPERGAQPQFRLSGDEHDVAEAAHRHVCRLDPLNGATRPSLIRMSSRVRSTSRFAGGQ
jgi:hypothetical protein